MAGAWRRAAPTENCPNLRSQTTASGLRRLCLALALPAAALATTPPAAAADGWLNALPPAGRLDYRVTRSGAEIGRQSVEFLRPGDELVVRTHIEIDVKFLSIPFYKFRHDAVERWTDGRLAAFSSSSDDDGKHREVELVAENGRLLGRYNDNPVDLPGDLIPASLWHPGTVQATVLLDPIRGRDRRVEVTDRGLETVAAAGGEIEARHYAMTGQITRDLWYDADGRLVLVRFPAKDGSQITVALK